MANNTINNTLNSKPPMETICWSIMIPKYQNHFSEHIRIHHIYIYICSNHISMNYYLINSIEVLEIGYAYAYSILWFYKNSPTSQYLSHKSIYIKKFALKRLFFIKTNPEYIQFWNFFHMKFQFTGNYLICNESSMSFVLSYFIWILISLY